MSFEPTFDALKQLLQPHAATLAVTQDEAGLYSLYTQPNEQYPKGEFFASVQIKKNYVSYYLMPVYCNPSLLEGMTPELKRRMQGKSCFNFKKEDPALLEQLAALTAKGLEDYQKDGKA